MARSSASDTPPPDEAVPAWAGARTSTCIGCRATDNHPNKRVIVSGLGTENEVIVDWHYDCHAIATGDAHSQAVVDQAGGAKGHALRVALAGDPEQGLEPTIRTEG